MDCLIIGKVWPEPSSTAAGRRTHDLMASLQQAGWTVEFASAAQRGPHGLDLKAIGVRTHSIAVNDPAFDQLIASLLPDVVIFDRFMTEEQFGWRVARHCPEALRVLDTSDLHCLRAAREKAIKNREPLDLYNDTALREIAAIYRSDLTLMISEFEMQVLRDDFALAEHLLAYWPFAVSLVEQTPAFDTRENFILIGSFQHPPNLDAARWCQQAIWPKIRKALPRAELHCYGSYGDRFSRELHVPEDGFHFKGRAADAQETMAQYRLNLAPLRYGAGLKGKVFDGFQTGTPSVMTAIAAEGICVGEGWTHTEPDAFAAIAIKWYLDPIAWKARQAAERKLCQDRFSPDTWTPRLAHYLSRALDEKEKRRQGNFIGRMLQHHHHRSTEFMSRWIEAKNK